MNVIIFGVTGYAGGWIARELVDRGHRVTGVSRNPGEVPDGVDVVQGDLRDSDFASRIAGGADVVVVAVRPSVVATPDRSFADVLLTTAIPAAERTGARLAIVAGSGTLVAPTGQRVMDAPTFNPAFLPESTQHAAALEALRGLDDGPDWFALSPPAQFGAAFGGSRTGRYTVGADALLVDEHGVSRISGPDYAVAFVDELERPRHHRTRFTVVG
ncbi:NAD(P)H-binding protein [Agromyces tropicus]|uniref:NAD(P)H-binding protein n=1 Tax=Agromyces tropicus TaxID=555371 RepID=A0ABP5FK43_9MICO